MHLLNLDPQAKPQAFDNQMMQPPSRIVQGMGGVGPTQHGGGGFLEGLQLCVVCLHAGRAALHSAGGGVYVLSAGGHAGSNLVPHREVP